MTEQTHGINFQFSAEGQRDLDAARVSLQRLYKQLDAMSSNDISVEGINTLEKTSRLAANNLMAVKRRLDSVSESIPKQVTAEYQALAKAISGAAEAAGYLVRANQRADENPLDFLQRVETARTQTQNIIALYDAFIASIKKINESTTTARPALDGFVRSLVNGLTGITKAGASITDIGIEKKIASVSRSLIDFSGLFKPIRENINALLGGDETVAPAIVQQIEEIQHALVSFKEVFYGEDTLKGLGRFLGRVKRILPEGEKESVLAVRDAVKALGKDLALIFKVAEQDPSFFPDLLKSEDFGKSFQRALSGENVSTLALAFEDLQKAIVTYRRSVAEASGEASQNINVIKEAEAATESQRRAIEENTRARERNTEQRRRSNKVAVSVDAAFAAGDEGELGIRRNLPKTPTGKIERTREIPPIGERIGHILTQLIADGINFKDLEKQVAADAQKALGMAFQGTDIDFSQTITPLSREIMAKAPNALRDAVGAVLLKWAQSADVSPEIVQRAIRQALTATRRGKELPTYKLWPKESSLAVSEGRTPQEAIGDIIRNRPSVFGDLGGITDAATESERLANVLRFVGASSSEVAESLHSVKEETRSSLTNAEEALGDIAEQAQEAADSITGAADEISAAGDRVKKAFDFLRQDKGADIAKALGQKARGSGPIKPPLSSKSFTDFIHEPTSERLARERQLDLERSALSSIADIANKTGRSMEEVLADMIQTGRKFKDPQVSMYEKLLDDIIKGASGAADALSKQTKAIVAPLDSLRDAIKNVANAIADNVSRLGGTQGALKDITGLIANSANKIRIFQPSGSPPPPANPPPLPGSRPPAPPGWNFGSGGGGGSGGSGQGGLSPQPPLDLDITATLARIRSLQEGLSVSLDESLSNAIKLQSTSAEGLYENISRVRGVLYDISPEARGILNLLQNWSTKTSVTVSGIQQLQQMLKGVSGESSILSGVFDSLRESAEDILFIIRKKPELLQAAREQALGLVEAFKDVGYSAAEIGDKIQSLRRQKGGPSPDEQELIRQTQPLMGALTSLEQFAATGKPISATNLEILISSMQDLTNISDRLQLGVRPTGDAINELSARLAALQQTTINATTSVNGLVNQALRPSLDILKEQATRTKDTSRLFERYTSALANLQHEGLSSRDMLKNVNAALRESMALLKSNSVATDDLASSIIKRHVAALRELKVSVEGVIEKEKEQEKVNYRGMKRSRMAAKFLQEMQSAFQGLMLGMGILQGNLRMVAFNIIFLSTSLLKVSVPVAALVVLFGSLVAIIGKASSAAADLADVRLGFQKMTGSIEEMDVALEYATELAIRFGYEITDVQSGLGTLTSAFLRTSENIEAVTKLSLGANISFQEAAQAYVAAIGDEKAALSSLTSLGVHFTKQEDEKYTAMGRVAATAEANRRIMEKYANATALAATSLTRLKTSLSEALKSIWGLIGSPFLQDFIIPIFRQVVELANEIRKLVKALMEWVKASGFWENALSGWKEAFEILKPTLRDLVILLRIGVVGAILVVITVFKVFGEIVKRVAVWINALWQGFKRWLQTFKPFYDSLRMMAQALKDLDFGGFLQAAKKAFENLPEPIRDAIRLAFVLITALFSAAMIRLGIKIAAWFVDTVFGTHIGSALKNSVLAKSAIGFMSTLAGLMIAALALGIFELATHPDLKVAFQAVIDHITSLFEEGEIKEGLLAIGSLAVTALVTGLAAMIEKELSKETAAGIRLALEQITEGDYAGSIQTSIDTLGDVLKNNLLRAILIAIVGVAAGILASPVAGLIAAAIAAIILPENDKIEEWFKRARDTVIDKVKGLWAEIKEIFSTGAGGLVDTIIRTFAYFGINIEPILEAISKFSVVIAYVWDVIVGLARAIWDYLKDWAKFMGEILGYFWDLVMKLFPDVETSMGKLPFFLYLALVAVKQINLTIETMAIGLNVIKLLILSVVGGIVSALSLIENGIRWIGEQAGKTYTEGPIFEGLLTDIEKEFAQTEQDIAAGWEEFKSAIAVPPEMALAEEGFWRDLHLPNEAQDYGSRVGESVVRGVSESISDQVGTGTYYGSLLGEGIVQGVTDGIDDQVGTGTYYDSIVDLIESGPIYSPMTEAQYIQDAMGYGSRIGMGINQGVLGSLADLNERGIPTSFEDMASAFDGEIGELSGEIPSAFSSLRTESAEEFGGLSGDLIAGWEPDKRQLLSSIEGFKDDSVKQWSQARTFIQFQWDELLSHIKTSWLETEEWLLKSWTDLHLAMTSSVVRLKIQVIATYGAIKQEIVDAIGAASGPMNTFREQVVEPLTNSFSNLASVIGNAKTAIHDLANEIRNLPQLPDDWQIHSPSNVELSIRGATEAMKDASGVQAPPFLAGLQSAAPVPAMATAGGGNTYTINVEVSGNYILDDKTADSLASRLAEKIDQKLFQRTGNRYNVGFVKRS